MNCKYCNGNLIETPEPPGSIHYARYVCSICGKFNNWVPKPENIDRRRDKNSKWRSMWKEKGFVCGICGATEKDFPNSGQWCLDHIIQLDSGGEDRFENTMMLCTFCHTIKNSEQSRRAAMQA